jgi:pSer/pThr/pTyr-binding forkhead associated (FHA) protein
MEALTAKVHQAPLSRWRGVPQWRVSVVDASNTERHFQVIAGLCLRVGTNPGNDIVVVDDTVSRAHAELTGEATGVRLHDLGSTNGCWAGGARIVEGVFSSGTITPGLEQQAGDHDG